ncbi:MAG: DNA-binding GntR family transcriptional regulator [Planctomycetota bacterium]|jgi:DNA-binding GntR family transcriptional regulator
MQENLSERAYEHIRKRLARGIWPAGTRLASRTLADEIGVSFTPVREAIQRLASERLVDFAPGAGASVRHPNRREVAELYDLRLVLEPFAAGLAARNASAYRLDEVEAANDVLRAIANELVEGEPASTDQVNRWLDHEEVFHTRLIDAADNRWLSKIGGELRFVSQVFSSQRGSAGLLTKPVAEVTCDAHAVLVDLLRQRDEAGAQDWARQQIELGKRRVLAYLERHDAEPS